MKLRLKEIEEVVEVYYNSGNFLSVVNYLEKKFTAVNTVSEDAKILKISQGEAIQLIETMVFNTEHKSLSFLCAK